MKHLAGLVLGTEEDWPAAFEQLALRLARFGGSLLGACAGRQAEVVR